MTNPLFQKDIISISEFTRDYIELVLKTARTLKDNPRMIFSRASSLVLLSLRVLQELVFHLKPLSTV